ncbi:MAG: hypothetical protein Fur0025_15610 [Oscillatoriaceae cyanobacterium]
MNRIDDSKSSSADMQLDTEKAGGVAGKVDGNQIIVNGNYSQVTSIPNPPDNAAFILNLNPSDYTPEELDKLFVQARQILSLIGDGT